MISCTFHTTSALNERVSPFDPNERFGKGNDLDDEISTADQGTDNNIERAASISLLDYQMTPNIVIHVHYHCKLTLHS